MAQDHLVKVVAQAVQAVEVMAQAQLVEIIQVRQELLILAAVAAAVFVEVGRLELGRVMCSGEEFGWVLAERSEWVKDLVLGSLPASWTVSLV